MQMTAGRRPRFADAADDCAAVYGVPFFYLRLRKVCVGAGHAAVVIDNNVIAENRVTVHAEAHRSALAGKNRLAFGGCKVNSLVEFPAAVHGTDSIAECA